MKRTLNLFSTLVMCIFVVSCGTKKSGEDYLASAQAFLDGGDRTAAIIEMKTALQADGSNDSVRMLLGKTYFEMGDFVSAEKELSRVYESGLLREQTLPILAQTLQAMGEHEKLDGLPSDSNDPKTSSIVYTAKGMSLLAQGDNFGAALLIEEALTLNPGSPYGLLGAAYLSLADQAETTARDQLEQVFALEPNYAAGWSLKGDIENRAGNYESAAEAYGRVIDLTYNNITDRLKRALVLLHIKENDLALADIAAVKKVAPEHPGAHFVEGLVFLDERNLEEAHSSFSLSARYEDAYPLSFYYLAAIDQKRGSLLLARKNIEQFLAKRPDYVLGLNLAATIELQEKKFKRAEKYTRHAISLYPQNIAALNLLANALLAQGENDEGVELLITVAELEPESAKARARLGAGFFALGDQEKGIQQLQETIMMDSGYQQAEVLIVLSLLNQQEFDEALEAGKEYAERYPESPTPHNLLAQVHLAQGEMGKARESLATALERAPQDPAANHSLAGMAFDRGDYAQAREFYQKVLAGNPNNLRTMLKLSATYAAEGKPELMVETLENAVKGNPLSAEPRLVLARYALSQGTPQKAQELFSDLPENRVEVPSVLHVITTAQLAQRNFGQALATLEKLSKVGREYAEYHYLRATAYAGLGEDGKTLTSLERTVAITPDHFLANLALAQHALVNDKLDLFEQRMSRLKKIAPDDSKVLGLEVTHAQHRGDQEYATQLLEDFFGRSPSSNSLVRLADQMADTGDSAGAVSLLQTWLSKNTGDIGARSALAKVYGKTQRSEESAEQYELILKENGDNVFALNNLAWHLRDSNPARALTLAKRGSSLAPDSASVLDTLAIVLLKNKKLDEAQRTIDRALKQLPDNPSILFHSAQIMVSQGDTGSAISTLEHLLANNDSFSDRKEAEKLLTQLQ
ncbi:MAG: XrtA/PEP-CTERM system TPR-repeat protein PrsT [Halioglobus sp.]